MLCNADGGAAEYRTSQDKAVKIVREKSVTKVQGSTLLTLQGGGSPGYNFQKKALHTIWDDR